MGAQEKIAKIMWDFRRGDARNGVSYHLDQIQALCEEEIRKELGYRKPKLLTPKED